MTTLKEQMNAQWQAKGVLHSGHGNAWTMRGDYIHARAGTARGYKSKEQKAYKAKLEQAAAIIAKVPEDELTAFLARFGLSLSLAASIASLGDVEMIARQFLRATL